ncbi:glutaminase [Neisseria meningitidis]|nr:glutaminase [Neisseria meningitidis]MCI3219059.1 glutaminase [Neisseria meningitidis]
MTVSGKPYTIRRLSCHTKPSPSNLNRPYGRVSFVALILQSVSVQVVVDVNHKQAACDNPVTSHSPYRYPSLLQAV